MKYCVRCNRRFKNKEEFCSSCGIQLLTISKQQRPEKTQKEKGQSTNLTILVIIFIFLLLMGAYAGIRSQQSNNNIILQQQILQNQKVNVKVMIDNDNNLDWFLYIDDMSTGYWGNQDNVYYTVQLTKEYHTFELRSPDDTILDSYVTNIGGGEEILLTI